MSDSEDADAAAVRLIELARVEAAETLDLSQPETRALTRLPPEIGGLDKLKVLDLRNTQVSDLSPLARLTGIKALWLNNTQVSDLSPLAGLTGMEFLTMDYIPATDLRPLCTLDNLVNETNEPNLSFWNTGAMEIDPRIAQIAAIENNAERARVLFEYLRGWEVPVPPVVPDQSPNGLQYKINDIGVVEYDPKATLGSPNIQQTQLHAILVEDCSDLLVKCGAGHNQPFSIYGIKLGRYRAGLGETLVDLQPVLVWKAGNDLRILLREDDRRYPGDMGNTPPLDPDLRAGIEGFFATQNALAAFHPDLSRLDVAQIDPAERHRLEQSRAIMEELLAAFAAQKRLNMTFAICCSQVQP